jgi:hypothetical protein
MDHDTAPSSSRATKKIPTKLLESAIEANPALKHELASMDQETAAKTLANIDISQLLTGLSLGNGKNQKDMASYKFWQTQPVPRFDDQANPTPVAQGPIKIIDPEKVPKTPDPLLDGFEWCTLDLTNETELRELYELLNNHYVEDDNAMFRFAYSESFLHWYDISTYLLRSVMRIADFRYVMLQQGPDVSWLEEGMAHRCPGDQVSQIGRVDLRCPDGNPCPWRAY